MKTQITFDQVDQSYNGKLGCMCGCLGKYTLPNVDAITAANRRVGWNCYDETNVSARRVKIALRKVNEALLNDTAEVHSSNVCVDENNGRRTVIYLNTKVDFK